MRKRRRVSYTTTFMRPTVPYIRLSGKWLGKLGFDIGASFRISIQGNSIVLTPIE